MRGLVLLSLGLVAFVGNATTVQAQGIGELLASIRNGGGWITIPVVSGKGRLLTGTLPTIGLRVAGCALVWGGHSGRWEIRAHDTQGGGRLEMDADAGESLSFDYTTGLTAQLDVNVRWSEPRDTTLLLWIGLEGSARDGEAACEPTYNDSVRPVPRRGGPLGWTERARPEPPAQWVLRSR